MADNKFSTRQSVNRSALPMVGSAANEGLHLILGKIDPELSKLFEDRNILLQDGGIITYTGTTLQFTESLKLSINQKVAGGSPVVIDLGSSDRTLSASGRMLYAVINRTGGTATVTDDATTLPAAASANQEVFLIAKRVDASDGTQRVYFRSGMALNAGQSVRLGSSGTGSGGSGTGDDLNALLFKASFTENFDEIPNSSASTDISAGKTDATLFSATNGYFRLAYDASKTVTGTGTSMTLSGTPSFTVKAGDMLIVGSEARRIASISSQTAYTLEAAFTTNPSAAAATVSQAVHTKDLNNYAGDGLAISSAFSASFSQILVDYEETVTADDKIFDANVAPVVGYTASSDGTNYTEVKIRETNLSDERQVVSLPTSGTNLYLRFFANKSSGTGFVNILKYKAFLHKGEAAEDGDSFDTAYCFTDGTGTEINCSTPVVVGGKTRIPLSFNYAVGVNAGTTNGALEVYLNGQKIPRFVDSTLTPDAYYKEISAALIELDDDYSSNNISVEVVRRVAVVDNSDINTTNISYQQEIMKNGFQGFVDTSNVLTATSASGTPAVGTFHSTIANRAPIVDITRDLKARIGVERISVQDIQEIHNEYGPNFERVYGALNDDKGRIRFVGNWIAQQIDYGIVVNSQSTSDFVEITFYGTGLNILFNNPGSKDIRATINGGAEGSNIVVSSASGILGTRNYSANMVIPVVSGLTPGLYTIKLRHVDGVSNNYYHGFEILNESTTLKVAPGIAYVGGKKLSLASESAIAYDSTFESGTLGSRGGRVIVYQKADGTIAKAVQPVDAAQANLTSASHANEEVYRTFHWREFGASRGAGDDFATLTNSFPSNRYFTLDDGSTTLVGHNTGAVSPRSIIVNTYFDMLDISAGGTGGAILLTFVGTGLDVVGADENSGTGPQVFVDGTSIGNLGTAQVDVIRRFTLVSGLPYGSHTVKISRVDRGWRALNFIVYGPKKPSLPTGAIELADYNVMGTYAVNAGAGVETIGTGVLRKSCQRELTYTGTWTFNGPTTGSYIGALQATSSTSGGTIQYTFFGTGFEFRAQAQTSQTSSVSVTLNGVAANTTNFPTMTASTYGGMSYSGNTLSEAVSNTLGSGLAIRGLPLAKYTVVFTNNTASAFNFEALDIITPIHSYKADLYGDLQNSLLVGSNALSDNREVGVVKGGQAPKLAWGQAVGITGSPTTTSTSYVPMPDMSVTIKTSGKPIEVIGTIVGQEADNGFAMAIFVDGREVQKLEASPTSTNQHRAITKIVPLAAGVHKVDLYWRDASGGGSAASVLSTYRVLTVKELPNG
jgi:hypothetical protein